VKLVCISDTHTRHALIQDLPEGDVLIHSGDSCNRGSAEDLDFFLSWFSSQPHKEKILIAGNHDWIFERHPDQARRMVEDHDVIYLCDESTIIDGVKFYGSPVQPEFCNWAFNRRRGAELKKYWDKIPKDTDVLITHGPPAGILDETEMTREPVGCGDLLVAVKRVKPKVHIFGHIHSAHGVKKIGKTTFINASQLDDHYRLVDEYKPIVFEL
jgi:Icc-related predicted phosphoesterase